jgi:hypothetical protein
MTLRGVSIAAGPILRPAITMAKTAEQSRPSSRAVDLIRPSRQAAEQRREEPRAAMQRAVFGFIDTQECERLVSQMMAARPMTAPPQACTIVVKAREERGPPHRAFMRRPAEACPLASAW